MNVEVEPLRLDTAWDYAPSIEGTDHFEIKKQYDLFIDGKFVKPSEDKYFDTINPATEEKLSEVALATKPDVDRAVKAARLAYDKYWSKMSGSDRGKYIYRLSRMINEKAKEFNVVETLDGGKPIKESRDVDVPLAFNHFFYNAGWADKLAYAFPNRNLSPMGVCGQIIPWNFPLLMAAWKLAPALATGNTVILKPAETTPLTAMLLAQIIQEADFPPGVINILTGAGDTGVEIVKHPGIDKIAFTGSTAVGKYIQRQVAGSGKKLSLELGGKGANIIMDDAPIDDAVEGVINGIFFNQGHVCCAGSRLFVQESVASLVIQKLKDRIATLRVGDPLDKNTDIGAINSKEQLKRIQEYINIGQKEGAEMFQSPCQLPSKGFYVKPTIFFNVTQSHKIASEEIFGPVLTVQTFRTVQEVIDKANNTPYGLSAGVWTDKGAKIFAMTSKLRAGVVWANTFNKFDPASPFGGYKESGFGREGGLHGLSSYLNLN